MILGRYIFREAVPSALLGTLLATFVIFLQKSSQVFEILIRSSARPSDAFYLFALVLPPLLPMTIPFGVLVGILIGLGRMSSDGEITAMRAAGIPAQKVIAPMLTFAALGAAAAAACSLWLTPAATGVVRSLANKMITQQLTAEIQERVFAEQFPDKIIYVGEVVRGPVVEWKKLFIADLTPPEQRQTGQRGNADGPLITVARSAIAVPDQKNSQIQLHMTQTFTHEVDKQGQSFDSEFPVGDQALPVKPPAELSARDFTEMTTRELPWHAGYSDNRIEAAIELHRRFALPIGCIALALAGIPLGISSRKGGKSGGYVTAVFLAFFCYYLSFFSLIRLAEQKTIPVWLAAWTPNIVFTLCGAFLLARLEKPGDRDIVGAVRERLWRIFKRLGGALSPAPRSGGRRFALMPQVIDTYILTQFLFYFVLMLTSFVLLIEIYRFFELLGDMVRNKIAMSDLLEYLLFLAPKLIYDTLPLSVLVAVLVTFGILTKHNEVTAFKASGVSLYRLSAPVLVASAILSAALFAFDYYYVPQANRRQEALLDKIKGRPVQTYLRPDRKWIKGEGERIYYYRYFDTAQDMMAGVRVYELDPATFRPIQEIVADRAQWQPSLRKWIFQNGVRRDMTSSKKNSTQPFEVMTFDHLNEPPEYFRKEFKQDKQMNFAELQSYIRDLQQSGFSTVNLQVQLHRKFSVPLFALIMAMISAPFAFLVGNRGAMAGVGASIGVAIAYLAISTLFEKVGAANYLPPQVAAWSPDGVFSLTGLYLLLRMRS